MNTAPIIGTRDFLPEKMALHEWLFDHWKETARIFRFHAYDAPIVESAELYTKKGGDEIISQMYNFQDKGNREVALRPEMTPSLARLIMANRKSLKLPIKWYSIAQCWRYESPQKGRKREHYQWNMDIFGVPTATAEIELLAAMAFFFKRIGLTPDKVKIKVSSRNVLAKILKKLQISDELYSKIYMIIDKLDKLDNIDIINALIALDGINEIIANNIIDSLKCDNSFNDDLELQMLFKLAESYGISEYLVYDPSIVRGLNYYTGIVFEAFDVAGKFRAIAGGGRYDNLLSIYGGENIPACGFGFGDCVIMDLLEELKLLPIITRKIDYVIIPWEETDIYNAIKLTSMLRSLIVPKIIDIILNIDKSIRWRLKYADNSGAPFAILVIDGKYNIKNLRATENDPNKQREISIEELQSL